MLGRAVQVAPIKPTLKPPGTKRLKLITEKLLSNFGFEFNLRRYSWATACCCCAQCSTSCCALRASRG
jgi:hypothetical protein